MTEVYPTYSGRAQVPLAAFVPTYRGVAEVVSPIVEYAARHRHEPAAAIAGATVLGAEGVAPAGRFKQLIASREVWAGVGVTARTMANLAISAVDLIPLVGNIPGAVADVLKLTSQGHQESKKHGLDFLTPHVSKSVAWWSELLEVGELAGIPVPSHLIETSIQFWKHDRHVMAKAWRTGRTILKSVSR